MRHCSNEVPNVYETTGDDLSVLLSEVAATTAALKEEYSWFNLTVGQGVDHLYLVTLYAH